MPTKSHALNSSVGNIFLYQKRFVKANTAIIAFLCTPVFLVWPLFPLAQLAVISLILIVVCLQVWVYPKLIYLHWLKRLGYYVAGAVIAGLIEAFIVFCLLAVFSLGLGAHERDAAIIAIPLFMIISGLIVTVILFATNQFFRLYFFPSKK